MATTQRHGRAGGRRAQRGAVTVETALALVIVALVLAGGITLSHAMTVRYVLSSATSRAVRVCVLSPGAGDVGPCVRDQVRAELEDAGVAARCPRLEVRPNQVRLAGVPVVQVAVSCGYAGMPGAGLLAREGMDGLVLTARATMPLP